MSLWVALDDATLDNGCLLFIPGSHRVTEYHRNAGIGEKLGELFDKYPEWEGRPEMEPIAVPMKAGAASFHTGMTAHGAGANMTPRRRRAMTCGYMPDGATFNGNPCVFLSTIMLVFLTVRHSTSSILMFGNALLRIHRRNVLPPDYLATLSIGDVLDNDNLNPLLWRSAGGNPRL